jgi:hypothetical protein
MQTETAIAKTVSTPAGTSRNRRLLAVGAIAFAAGLTAVWISFLGYLFVNLLIHAI